ncbi:MAG: SRPBCC domain-containing protein [Acidobacteriaceae bacterium]
MHSEGSMDNRSLTVTHEMEVHAPLEATFESLLEQLGPENSKPDGSPMPMKLEPWPGGRWFRDNGSDNGHLWAHVQAIRRPTLLEFTGPLFMSTAVVSNVQYRLSEIPTGTLIKFRHTAFGLMDDEHKQGVKDGWGHMIRSARDRAERRSPKP